MRLPNGERIAMVSISRAILIVVAGVLLGACASGPRRNAGPSSPPLVAGSARADAANAVLFRAIALVGIPYRYGGNTPQGGFDCSGLVSYVFRDAAGVALPRTSAQMSKLGQRKLAIDTLQSGDLVFFESGGRVSHVGIYVGDRRFVNAPNSGGTVRLDSLDSGWWRKHFVYGKRVLR